MSNSDLINTKLLKIKREQIPLFTLTVALVALGFFLFYRISLSKQPPIFDALTYVQKAQNFWDAVSQFRLLEPKTWFSPMNVEPAFRPFGTILMSYPFGFSDSDVHGFFFRSIFLPIVLFVAALWINARSCCTNLRSQWVLVTLCIAFATLPLFYHFEPSLDGLDSPTYFGLVDNFISSVAALAAALILQGVQKTSIKITISGIFVTTFCLLIKPSGILIMLAIFLVWLVHATVYYSRRHDVLVRKYLISSMVSFVFIYGITLLLCLTSNYLSPANLAFGTGAQVILQEGESLRSIKDSFNLLKTQIHSSLGWHWIVFVSLICLCGFLSTSKKSYLKLTRALPLDLISALNVLLIGLWFWLISTGQSQIRYFLPFVLISIVLMISRMTVLCSQIPTRYLRVVSVSLVFPMSLLSIILLLSNPPNYLQRTLGVNLTSGSLKNEILQAKTLIENARRINRDLMVYAPDASFVPAVFQGVGFYEKMLHPNLSSFTNKYPVDWVNSPTIRFSDISTSDYLLLVKPIEHQTPASQILTIVNVPDFPTEVVLFNAWLNTVNHSDAGIEFESQTSLLKLLKIVDRRKLDFALNQLKNKHQWRQVFLDANQVRWIDAETAKSLVSNSKPSFRDINFGNQFTLLGAFINRRKDNLRIEFVWQSLKEQPLTYFNFVHILDQSKNIIGQSDYEQSSDKRTVSKSAIWHDVVTISYNKLKKAKFIGFGIYSVSNSQVVQLPPSRGWTDSDRQRLIFDLEKE